MAQDFNLADDMKIRLEQALVALSEARDAIDSASDGLKDALHNVDWSQRQARKAHGAREVQQRDQLLALGADCLAALSRYLDGQQQQPEEQAAPSQAAPSQAAPSQAAPSQAAQDAEVLARAARVAEEALKASQARRKKEGQ